MFQRAKNVSRGRYVPLETMVWIYIKCVNILINFQYKENGKKWSKKSHNEVILQITNLIFWKFTNNHVHNVSHFYNSNYSWFIASRLKCYGGQIIIPSPQLDDDPGPQGPTPPPAPSTLPVQVKPTPKIRSSDSATSSSKSAPYNSPPHMATQAAIQTDLVNQVFYTNLQWQRWTILWQRMWQGSLENY